jgi:5-methylcytosine-specific restriction endonuclease McrA
MGTQEFWDLGGVSDSQLRSGLAALLASGYRTEARIVAHIAEAEQRKLHLKDGCASLFEYCVKQLGLSESEAFHRLTAARIARKFPVVFSLLERRELHLTAVCLLRDYLTSENHLELLAEASHKTKLQVQELLARRFPRPDVPSYVRKLPVPIAAKLTNVHDAERGTRASLAVEQPPPRPQAAPAAPTRARVEPTSEARYRIQLNASSSLKEKLELFQSLVSHSIPSGDVAAALERALDLALEQVQKRRFAKTDKPRRSRGTIAKRASLRREHVPNATQREVAARDGLQCTYVGIDSGRCSSRAFLQMHHEQPWARGGSSSAENLRLLCSAHNRLVAERDFGREHVAERIAERRSETTSHARPSYGMERAPAAPALASAGGTPPSPPLARSAMVHVAVSLRHEQATPGDNSWEL